MAEVLSVMKSCQDKQKLVLDEIAKMSAHSCKRSDELSKRMDSLEASQRAMQRQTDDIIARQDHFSKSANESRQK
jgi:hypothetical protein